MSSNESTTLNSAGGPIFRRPDLSHEEFTAAWHRHGQLCAPWCLNFGVWEYIQIHLPPAVRTEELEPGTASRADDDTIESKARRVLQQADGVAIMRRYDVPTEAGRQFFEGVVLTDERSFLHDESGAGAVKGNPPVYDVPDLHVDVWREMALNMGGVEHDLRVPAIGAVTAQARNQYSPTAKGICYNTTPLLPHFASIDPRALLHRSKRISRLMQPPQSSTAAGCSIGNSEEQQRASQASDTAKITSLVRIPLRDETLAIRQLFGYSDKCQLSSAHKAFNLGATLPNSSMKDVLLIGIDVDTYQGYKHLHTDPQLHIGVSILDTRVLHDLIHKSPDSMRETDALESYQFVIGDSRYCKTASRRFMFGKSQSIPLGEVKARIESLVCRQGRDNILVFHGDHSDRKALSNLDIQLQPLYIIDNVKAAQFPLGLPYRLGLEAMLDTFGIPYANLHAAGNDAHYALRSLLMIAVTDGQKMELEPTSKDLFSTFSAIARSARPTTAGEKGAALEESRRQAKAKKTSRYKARRAARAKRRRRECEARIETDGQCSPMEDAC